MVQASGFGHLVSNGPEGLTATGLPFLAARDAGRDGDQLTLRGHVARANLQWRTLDGAEVMVIFPLAEGYVSPSWYPSKADQPARRANLELRGGPRPRAGHRAQRRRVDRTTGPRSHRPPREGQSSGASFGSCVVRRRCPAELRRQAAPGDRGHRSRGKPDRRQTQAQPEPVRCRPDRCRRGAGTDGHPDRRVCWPKPCEYGCRISTADQARARSSVEPEGNVRAMMTAAAR